MAATGAFATLLNRTLTRTNVIYRSPSTPPTSGTSPPINRMPAAPAPQQPGSGLTPPTAVYPVNVDPPHTGDPVIQEVSTFGTGTSGGGNTSGTTGTSTPSTTTPGTTTGAGSGGDTGGGGTDSRLLDLLANAFKPQDISQPYGPISSGPVDVPSSGGGVNPALIILAFVAIVGVMWWMNRKKRAAA